MTEPLNSLKEITHGSQRPTASRRPFSLSSGRTAFCIDFLLRAADGFLRPCQLRTRLYTTPFAAFAVAAAATVPLRPALLVVSGAWLVHQSIVFRALHYSIDASMIAWGFVIGAASLQATAASSAVLRAPIPNPPPRGWALHLAF